MKLYHSKRIPCKKNKPPGFMPEALQTEIEVLFYESVSGSRDFDSA